MLVSIFSAVYGILLCYFLFKESESELIFLPEIDEKFLKPIISSFGLTIFKSSGS